VQTSEKETSGAPSSAPAPLSLAELADEYMAAYQGRDRTRPAILAWWCSHYGPRAFSSLTEDDVHAGLEELRTTPPRRYAGLDVDGRPIYRAAGKKRTDATVNRYHAAIMALFTWSIKRRRAPKGWENPARKVERPREKNQVIRFLTDVERKRLLEACRASAWPQLYLLVLMAITTGARRSELLGLTWRDVDLERAMAHVHTSKNGEARALPLLPAVLAELARFASEHPQELVFRSRAGRTEPARFDSSWHSALERAGVKRFRFHDLRHCCASYLAQEGASLLEIADVLGHKSLTMSRRYAHLTVDSKAKLLKRVMGEIK
jgi:integrase